MLEVLFLVSVGAAFALTLQTDSHSDSDEMGNSAIGPWPTELCFTLQFVKNK